MTTPTHDPYAALRVPANRLFLGGMSGVFLATQIQTTVLGLEVYEITRRTEGVGEAAWQVGLIGLAEAVPFLSLTLFGGFAADRWDRRKVCLAGLFGLLLGAALLVYVHLTPPTAVWPFLVAQAIAGAARALLRPGSMALGTELVGKELYSNAAAWRSNLFQTATVVGPALGTLLYASVGPLWTYAATAVGYLIGITSISAIRDLPARARSTGSVLGGLLEGVGFVFRNQVVLAALSLDLFAVLFGGATAMIPAFALDVLESGPESVGWLRASPAVGALLMGVWIARRGNVKKAGKTLLLSVAAFGLTWILFSLSTSLVWSLLLLATGGALDSISVVLRSTLVQVQTPPELMGRVAAVNSFFIGSSNELGAFESGAAARLIGLVPSVLIGGCLTIGTAATVAALAPKLRRLDTVG